MDRRDVAGGRPGRSLALLLAIEPHRPAVPSGALPELLGDDVVILVGLAGHPLTVSQVCPELCAVLQVALGTCELLQAVAEAIETNRERLGANTVPPCQKAQFLVISQIEISAFDV